MPNKTAPLGKARGGEGGDIDQATRLACAMIGSLGLAGPTPLIYRGSARQTEDLLRFADVRRAANAELEVQAEACRLLLESHREAMLSVARRLRERGRIGGAEVAKLISTHSMRRPTAKPTGTFG